MLRVLVQDPGIQLLENSLDEVGGGILGGWTLVPETVVHISGPTVLKLECVEEDDVEFTESINQSPGQEGEETKGNKLVEDVHR